MNILKPSASLVTGQYVFIMQFYVHLWIRTFKNTIFTLISHKKNESLHWKGEFRILRISFVKLSGRLPLNRLEPAGWGF